MPRSVKDSEEEVDVKTAGRKTRLTDVGSADTSLRRSTRIKLVKQNDSSPESNDSSVSNTQTRVTRKRTGTMDNTTATEKQRVLRSRRNSVSSDVSETPEVDATTTATPTKRNRHSIVNDMLNRTGSQRIKRLTRAGSESKSPPLRVTRNTRATSMEPETNAENNLIQRDEHELTRTPVRTRRRTSIIPSEATVLEEKEETLKILMVTLDRTLPNVSETKENDSDESVPNTENTPDTKHQNVNEEEDKDNTSEQCNNLAENPPPKSVESVEKDISTDDKNVTPVNDKNVLEESKNLVASTGTEMNSSQSSIEKMTDDDKNVSEETSTLTDMNSSQSFLQKMTENDKSVSEESKNLLTSSVTEIDSSQTLSQKITDDDKDVSEETNNVLTSTVIEINSSETFSQKITDDKNVPEENKTVSTPAVTEMDSSIHNSSEPFSQKADQNTSKELGLKIENLLTNSIEKHEDFSNKENLAANIISDEPNIENTGSNTPVQSPKPLSVSNSNKLIKEKCKSPCNLLPRSRHSKSSESMDDSPVKEVDNDVTNNSVVENLTASPNAEDTDNSDMPKLAIESDSLSGTTLNTSPDRNISVKICTDSSSCDSIELIRCTDDVKSPDNSDKLTESNEEATEIQDEELNEIETDATSSVEKITNVNEDSEKDTKQETSINDKDNVKEEVKPGTSDNVQETPTEVTEGKPEKEDLSTHGSSMSKDQPIEKSVEQKSESIQETCTKNQESMDVDDNDSDKNAATLFQDIPANEWKEKNVDIDKNSIHSVSTERLEHETEAECDLVLVDKEAWLAAENIKAEKEAEASDYDSDDTVVLKMQRDSRKGQKIEQMEIDTSADNNKINISKEASTNESNIDNENLTKNTKDSESETPNTDSEAVNQNKSITEKQNKHSTSKHNVSNRKSTEGKDLNESHKTIDTEENLSSDKNNLSESISKKRKSLNKSVREVDETESTEKKSLNKSNKSEEEKETADAELDSGSDIMTSAKKNKKKRSLNISSKKQVACLKESDNDSKESSLPEKRKSKKKKFEKNRSLTRNVIDSDSESNSDDSQNETIELPKFLLGEGSNTDSDNESDKSIDSDIEREYNLDGKDTCKFSDDDVPGDECRASETESSDPDDNGSDLADFVVYDDVEEEEDESEESGNEEENIEINEKEDAVEKETSENEKENYEADVSVDTSVKRKSKLKMSDDLNTSDAKSDNKKQKSKKIDTSQNEKEHSLSDASLSQSLKMKKAKQKRAVSEFIVEDIEQPLNDSYSTFNKGRQKLNKCSTPKSHYLPTTEEADEKTKTASDSKTDTSIDKRKIEDSKAESSFTKLSKQKSKENLVDKHLPSELAELVENVKLSKPLPSKVAELNKTIAVLDSETPTTKYLKKDRLNDTAPVLKLDSKLTKINDDEQNKTLNQLEEESEDVNTEEINTSLKQKLLKVADNILEADRRKKHKKRKQKEENSNPDKLIADDDFHEDTAPQVLIDSENIVSATNTDKNEIIEEVVLNEGEKKKKRKKKKKKQKLTPTDITEQIDENIEPESTKKLVPKKVKKKQEIKLVENVSDTQSENQILEKKKKESTPVWNEEITTQISKKKQKSLSEDITLSGNERTTEKLPKRKKKLSEDVVLEHEVPSRKRKKDWSSNDFSESDNILVEKAAKKKHKLLVEDEKKSKAKSAKATFNDAGSDSDEGPTVVTFAEARDEALKIIKHTADSIKANKEMKKKKRKERMEEMERDKELKNEKQKLRKQEIKAKEIGMQKGIKRLPDDLLENLSDIPVKRMKNISKREGKILPSRTMFNLEDKTEDTYEDDFVPLSSCGATTNFAVANIQKIKKKKKIPGIGSFKQKMLARNSRQPISAYLMCLKKQKVSGNDNFCSKPY
nr:PREDICTED: calponin homology domain-containing protein DDB_G0272472-like isoform X4 [Megachile rotundata]